MTDDVYPVDQDMYMKIKGYEDEVDYGTGRQDIRISDHQQDSSPKEVQCWTWAIPEEQQHSCECEFG